jgi:hypothetical protein
MKTLLISCVLVVTSCLTNGASADATPPQEITKHFAPEGQIVQYVELQMHSCRTEQCNEDWQEL